MNGGRRPLLSPAFHLGLLVAGTVACAALDLTRPVRSLALLGLTLAAALALRAPLRTLLCRLLPLLSCGCIALAVLLLVSAGPGAQPLRLWGWERPVASHAAGFLGALWVKSGLLVLWLTALTHGLSERDLLEGLTAWHLPRRVTAVTYLMIRGLHAVRDDIGRLMRARAARGRPRGLYALWVAAALSQTLLLRLGRRAETQALALTARGFGGRLELLEVRSLRCAQGLLLLLVTGALLWLTHC